MAKTTKTAKKTTPAAKKNGKTEVAKTSKKTVSSNEVKSEKSTAAPKTAKATKKATPVKKATTAKKTVASKKTVAKKETPVKKASPAPKTAKKTAVVKKEELREKQIKETMDKLKNTHPIDNTDEEWGDYTPPIVGFTRYSDEDLKMFRDLINKKLVDAKEELEFYKEQLVENAMNETDSKSAGLEDGGQTNEKEYLNNMANRQMKFISNLENALIRIENKTYGICRKTGELIDKKRLMAVPHATLSMDAKLGK